MIDKGLSKYDNSTNKNILCLREKKHLAEVAWFMFCAHDVDLEHRVGPKALSADMFGLISCLILGRKY